MESKAVAVERRVEGAIRGGARVRRRGAGLTSVAAALLTTLSACGGGAGGNGDGAAGAKEAAASRAHITLAPGDGAHGVDTTGAVKVTSDHGRLTKVLVEDSDGKRVAGRAAEGGTVWRPEGHLATDTTYTVRATARDGEGRTRTKKGTFTTVDPETTFIGRFTPEDGSTVGVGMPVSLEFDHPVADSERDAVEKAISVTADPEVDVEGHWFGDSRLDFRPKEYWKPGTKVTLDLGLDGVEASDGVYGTQDKSVSFRIGRSQVSVVDAKKKTMTVTRDGKKIKTYPISSGSDKHPTYNGRMVISERHRETRMDGRTVGFGRDEEAGGYDIKDVPHAMRLSTSGTFIHGNYWTPKYQFGEVNASHGCVGLYDKKGGGDESTPAAWFYAHSMIGDVVEIKNSKDETIQPDNGLNGWNMDWDEWTADQ